MKKQLLFWVLIVLCIDLYSQTKNRIEFAYSLTDNSLHRKEALLDGAASKGKGSNIFSLRYQRNLFSSFSIETGLEYSQNTIELSYISGYGNLETETAYIEMISIPVYGNYSFWKYFYFNAGATIDFELNTYQTQPTDKQSGIGLGFGLGGKYNFNNLTVFINPFFLEHAVIPFDKAEYQERIIELGIKFGLGYNF
jgi:hypothetical protein